MDPDKFVLSLLPVLTPQTMSLSQLPLKGRRGDTQPPTPGVGFQHSQWLSGTALPPSQLQPVFSSFSLGVGLSWLLHTPTHLHLSSSSAQTTPDTFY